MRLKSIFLASALTSLPAMAHEDFDVEAYSLTLKGTQPFGEACYVGVVEQGLDEVGFYFAEVETSFNHEGVGPGRLLVTRDAARPGFLSASHSDGTRISIRLSAQGTTIADALRYAVRWNHEGHTDSGLCDGLTVIHDAE